MFLQWLLKGFFKNQKTILSIFCSRYFSVYSGDFVKKKKMVRYQNLSNWHPVSSNDWKVWLHRLPELEDTSILGQGIFHFFPRMLIKHTFTKDKVSCFCLHLSQTVQKLIINMKRQSLFVFVPPTTTTLPPWLYAIAVCIQQS